MELKPFWAALLRRWYLTVVGLALTIVLTFLMVARIGPTYEAEGTMLLFPPMSTIKNGTTVETQGNPYLMLGGLNQARDIVLTALSARSAREEFAAQHPSSEYEVTPDFTTSGPLIVIAVRAESAQDAVAGLAAMPEAVKDTLASIQSDLHLPRSAYITAKTLSADASPEVVRTGQIRGGIVAGAVVMVIMLFLVGLSDGLLTARADRRERSGRGRETKSRMPAVDARSGSSPAAAHVDLATAARDNQRPPNGSPVRLGQRRTP